METSVHASGDVIAVNMQMGIRYMIMHVGICNMNMQVSVCNITVLRCRAYTVMMSAIQKT